MKGKREFYHLTTETEVSLGRAPSSQGVGRGPSVEVRGAGRQQVVERASSLHSDTSDLCCAVCWMTLSRCLNFSERQFLHL